MFLAFPNKKSHTAPASISKFLLPLCLQVLKCPKVIDSLYGRFLRRLDQQFSAQPPSLLTLEIFSHPFSCQKKKRGKNLHAR